MCEYVYCCVCDYVYCVCVCVSVCTVCIQVQCVHARVCVQIATSVAARGLDVKELILVVNYDCPNHYEDYVHRVGSVSLLSIIRCLRNEIQLRGGFTYFTLMRCRRTGRAGNHGYAYTFVTPDKGRYAGEIVKALQLSGAAVPPELQALWDNYKAQAEAVCILHAGLSVCSVCILHAGHIVYTVVCVCS